MYIYVFIYIYIYIYIYLFALYSTNEGTELGNDKSITYDKHEK